MAGRPGAAAMKARALIGLLALVVLTLLVWELRWVLLVLFGAVVAMLPARQEVTVAKQQPRTPEDQGPVTDIQHAVGV